VAPADPKLILFRDGLADLAAMGVTDEKLGRRMLGRWLRDTGGDAARVVSALIEAKAQGPPADPIPYITRLLNKSSEFSDDGRVGRSQDRRPGGLGRLTMHLAARAASLKGLCRRDIPILSCMMEPRDGSALIDE
jgi:hypothetical protein